MKISRILGRKVVTLASAVSLLGAGLIIGGVTMASGSSSTATYYACLRGGSLSKVGTTTPKCPRPSRVISWDRNGVTGATGPVGAQGIAGQGYSSTTSNSVYTIAVGSATFGGIADTGAYIVGQRVRIIATTTPADYVEGVITAISSNASITVLIDSSSGTGSYSAWTFSIAGNVGAQGPSGRPGAQGAQGAQGAAGAPGSSTQDCSVAPYAGVDFSGCNFAGADLSNANLAGANLTGANLTGANLTGANLSGANLNDANLTSATITGANLTFANLSTVNFTGVTFATGFDIGGANVQNTNFSGAILGGYITSGGLSGAPVLPNGWTISSSPLIIGQVIYSPNSQWSATNQFGLCNVYRASTNCMS